MGNPPGPRKTVRLLRAIGLRVLVWGGLAGLVLLWFGDLPSLVAPLVGPRPAGVEQEPAGEEDPSKELPDAGWPHLRGPHYNAISDETGLADSWPAEGPPALWSGEIGRGYSALIAAGDRVYTQRQTVADQSVLCLDARDGSTVWTSGSQPASYCSAMPIRFRGQHQVIAFLQNTLAAFDLASGRLLWEQSYSHGYDEHAAMPLYDEPYLMTMVPFRGGSQLYRIERQTKSPPADGGPPGLTAALVRSSKQMSNDVASSVLVAGWYLFSLVGVLAVAGAIAALFGGLIGLVLSRLARRRSPADPARADKQPVAPGWAIFWLVALVLGVAGTPLYNRLGEGFVFTWPVSLFAGQQLALLAILHARRNPQRHGPAWLSLAAVLGLLVVCLAYYDVCRRLTLAIAWVFLMGFLPSWPLAIPAASSLLRNRRPWAVLLWTLLAFSLYFWASSGFIFIRVWMTIGNERTPTF